MKRRRVLRWESLWLAIIFISCGYSAKVQKLCSDWDKKATSDIPKDSILNDLQSNYKILIYLNLLDANGYNDQYYFIGNKKNQWYKVVYRYTSHAFEVGKPKPIIYTTEPLRKSLGDSILNVFTETGFCNIKLLNEACDPLVDQGMIRCGPVMDYPGIALGIVFKGKFIEARYYSPEYLDSICCPGNKDSQIFIKCKRALVV